MAKSSGSAITDIVRRSRPFCDHDPGASQDREALINPPPRRLGQPRPHGTNSQRVVAALREQRHRCRAGPKKRRWPPPALNPALVQPGQDSLLRPVVASRSSAEAVIVVQAQHASSAHHHQHFEPRSDHTRTSRPQLAAIGAVFAGQTTPQPCTTRRRSTFWSLSSLRNG